MHITYSEVIATGSAVGWFLSQIYARKGWLKSALKWLFGLTFAVALCVALWGKRDEYKALSISQGSNSDIVIAQSNNSAVAIQSSPASLSVQGSPGATVNAIQNSPNATQNVTVHQGPKKRTVSPEQAQIMKSILAPEKGSKITIVFKMNNSECEQFSSELERVFADVGWGVHRIATVSVGGPHLGIWLRVSTNDIEESKVPFANVPEGLAVFKVPPRISAVLLAVRKGLGMDCEMVQDNKLGPSEMDLRIEEAD